MVSVVSVFLTSSYRAELWFFYITFIRLFDIFYGYSGNTVYTDEDLYTSECNGSSKIKYFDRTIVDLL